MDSAITLVVEYECITTHISTYRLQQHTNKEKRQIDRLRTDWRSRLYCPKTHACNENIRGWQFSSRPRSQG